jgi:hypothetical protein
MVRCFRLSALMQKRKSLFLTKQRKFLTALKYAKIVEKLKFEIINKTHFLFNSALEKRSAHRQKQFTQNFEIVF